jgi:dTDP-4-amino-4,6-dideoxygalactose transaminase
MLSEQKEATNILQRYLGVENVLLTINGTASLHAIILALEIPAGSEIIFPVDGYPPLIMVALICGLRPVFADVDENGNLDPDSLLKHINSFTRAVVSIHMAGTPVSSEISKIVSSHQNIHLIEDCCQALGSIIKGSVQLSDNACAGILSFSDSKIGGIGFGGAVFSRSNELAREIGVICNSGLRSKHNFDKIGLGLEFPSSLLTTLLNELRKLNQLVEERISFYSEISEMLNSDFKIIPGQKIKNVVPHKLITFYSKIQNHLTIENELLNSVETHYPKVIFKEAFFLKAASNKLVNENDLNDFRGYINFSRNYLAFRYPGNMEKRMEVKRTIKEFVCKEVECVHCVS